MKDIVQVFFKLNFLVFLILQIETTFAAGITYDIFHHPQKLHVKLEFNGNQNGITEIKIPTKIWGHDLNKQIMNIEVIGKNTLLKNHKIINHAPYEKINLSYDIVNFNGASLYRYFYSRIQEEGFFLLNDFALVSPKITNHCKVKLRFHTEKENSIYFAAENLKSGNEITIPFQEFDGGIILAGNNKFVNYYINDNHTKILFYNVSHNNSNKIKKISDQIVRSQQNFCNCETKTGIFVFLEQNTKHQSYRGTLLKNGVVIVLIPKKIDDLFFKNLISHENFHKFIGSEKYIRFNTKNEFEHKWFSEGFTDYFSLLINRDSRLITELEYLKSYEVIFRRYINSEFRNLTYKELCSQYWKNQHMQKIIYDRGHIMAKKLDEEIREVSNKTLKDVLCRLIQLFKEDKKLMFSKELFIKTTREVTGYDLSSKINNLIDGRELL